MLSDEGRHTRGVSAAPDVVDQPNPHGSSASAAGEGGDSGGGGGGKKLTPDEMMAKVNQITY